MKLTSTKREECQETEHLKLCLRWLTARAEALANVIGLRAFFPVKHARASQGFPTSHTKVQLSRFLALRGDKAMGAYPTPELETIVDCHLYKCIRSIYGRKLNKK
jgi:hypothetical protein